MRDREALTILIEQIGSLTYGKERWFEQDGGIWYDRKQGDHIRLSDVVYRAVGAVYEECESDRDCEAIPIDWIWRYWDDGDKPKNYALHIRDMINEWKEEQAEKYVVLHPCDINFVSEEAEKEYYESLGFESED